jgi:hypothetical protein
MNYQELYLETIHKLKRNERPLIKLNQELINHLKDEWPKAFNSPSVDKLALEKILCILDNTQNTSNQFTEMFLTIFAKIEDDQLLIFALASSQKHVIAEAFKSGDMIPAPYFDELKKLLKNKNPEVLEWTLRTIDCLGPLSLRLKKEIREVKPGFKKFFNHHQKSSFAIIELLEKQWENI